MNRPLFATMWRNFPDHLRYPSLKDLYTWQGGKAVANIAAFGENGNTCASRMSIALNMSEAPIDGRYVSSNDSIGTADGHRIIFRVSALRQYFVTAFGRPALDKITPYDDAFRGKRGVIMFSINFRGATGHAALFDGTTYREPDHDDYSSFVNPQVPGQKTSLGEFWELL